MSLILSETVENFLAAANPDPGDLLAEMTEHGRERGFPIVGADVGQFLRTAAMLADAERVFEFGSGFGYSAAWFLSALPDDGEIVLTDYDEDNLAEAREFLPRTGSEATIHYEAGDARESFADYEGPFDVVLIDSDKSQYAETFELAREAVPAGGIVVADNMMAGPVEPADVTAALEGAEPADEHVAGIADYIERVRDDPDFETVFVPLGEGIALSYRKK